MEIKMVSIRDVKPYEKNPRKNARAVPEVVKSLKEFGWQQPLVVDTNMVLIVGHTRLLAAKELKMKEVPVHIASELSETQARAYRVMDNRTSDHSDWDYEVLLGELDEMFAENNNMNLDFFGFDTKDFDAALGMKEDREEKEEEEALQDPGREEEEVEEEEEAPYKVEPRVKLGDTWQLGRHLLYCGDSTNAGAVHSIVAENEAHAIVTDPPYGLSFMGKAWDKGVPSKELWKIWLSRIRPGAPLLSFSGTRTYHRMTVAIEDAGFEIRDQIQWIYGQGFPKSQDISKAIDKAAGVEREVVGTEKNFGKTTLAEGKTGYGDYSGEWNITTPTTPEAKQWSGWGTALKPANEPICLARKPLSESTVAKNVLMHGTGGLNIDGTRIEGAITVVPQPKFNTTGSIYNMKTGEGRSGEMSRAEGRFPSNVILDEDAAAVLDEQSGVLKSGARNGVKNPSATAIADGAFKYTEHDTGKKFNASEGGASRFFYVAKSSKSDRGEGNNHATVKPIRLMEYLIKMVTPNGGTVLEPFAGSGTTLIAAEKVGARCIAFELDPHHCDIILARWEAVAGVKASLT